MQAPIRPQPKAAQLDRNNTAVAVLDLTGRCDDPAQPCAKLIAGVASLLERARAAQVPVVFTATPREQGTPEGKVADGLDRRDAEPFIYADGFDKFQEPAFKEFLAQQRIQNLVIVGAATNIAVLYTATGAARNQHYQVYIPVDGVTAGGSYEHEYALHQLSVLPTSATPIQFTQISMVEFR